MSCIDHKIQTWGEMKLWLGSLDSGIFFEQKHVIVDRLHSLLHIRKKLNSNPSVIQTVLRWIILQYREMQRWSLGISLLPCWLTNPLTVKCGVSDTEPVSNFEVWVDEWCWWTWLYCKRKGEIPPNRRKQDWESWHENNPIYTRLDDG